MTEPKLPEVLSHLRFLEGLTEGQLRQLASVASVAEYAPDTVLFRERERLGQIFLVVQGSVALDIRVPPQGLKRICTVGAGELLGWSPVLQQTPMTATARALQPTRVVALDAAQVLALCHHDTAFGFAFMRQTALALAQRLEATRLQLLDVYRTELPTVAQPDGGGR